MRIHQHGLNRSVLRHLRERLPEVKVDLHFDGYKIPEERPLITVEQMQNSNEVISKQSEGVEVTYRYQVGLYDDNSVNLSINQERLQDVFLYDKFTFYDTLKDSEPSGSFLCELNAIVPIRPESISDKSGYNRVYFDIEITTIRRRMI